MITIERAYELLSQNLSRIKSLPPSETLAGHHCLGRVLAQAVSCLHHSPPFDQSAMDGIAFLHREGLNSLTCKGTIAAGDPPDQIRPGPGECVRIMTGAPVPSCTDTVQMVEKLSFSGDRVRLLELPEKHRHIRFAGENFKAGDLLYPEGTTVTPGVLAGLLSQGLRFAQVRPPLRIGIGGTGNEIVDYRRPLQPGQIYNSNASAVAALLGSPSVVCSQLGVFPDDLEQTEATIRRNADLDVLVLSGGVSMGSFDMVPEAAERAGFRKIFHKVRLKPGKPLWFGVHEDSGTLLFGLPGNPVSAMVGCALFIQPLIRALLSGSFRPPVWLNLPLGEELANRGRLPLLVGGRLQNRLGKTLFFPLKTSGSGDILRFSKLDALAKITAGTLLPMGRTVQVLLPFQPLIG